MKALVIAYGDGDSASTVYRYRAGERHWREQGHELEILSVRRLDEAFWRTVGSYDVIINQKALLGERFARRLRAAGRPVFFDFDDAIWTRPKKPYSWWTQLRVNHRIRCWFSSVRGILAANQHLANFARRFRAEVEIVPMALDLDVWRPASRSRAEVRIGWAGSPGNLWHLERLQEPLARLLQACPSARLAVFCGRRPSFSFPFEFVPYSPGAEQEFVSGLDIGLLPLHLEPYTLGKSPIKALHYMSCGVAVVGNVAGATAEILNPENSIAIHSESEWLPVLQEVVSAPALIRRMGAAGRRFVEQHHDLRKSSERLMSLLSRVC